MASLPVSVPFEFDAAFVLAKCAGESIVERTFTRFGQRKGPATASNGVRIAQNALVFMATACKASLLPSLGIFL
jgi:hypothetical protein